MALVHAMAREHNAQSVVSCIMRLGTLCMNTLRSNKGACTERPLQSFPPFDFEFGWHIHRGLRCEVNHRAHARAHTTVHQANRHAPCTDHHHHPHYAFKGVGPSPNPPPPSGFSKVSATAKPISGLELQKRFPLKHGLSQSAWIALRHKCWGNTLKAQKARFEQYQFTETIRLTMASYLYKDNMNLKQKLK